MFESSIVGVFKTIVFIIGVSVIIRFIGRLLIIKRNLNDEKDFLNKRRKEEKLKRFVNKNEGKITIKKSSSKEENYEDISYEDVD